jgi:hypothetical protein
MWMFYIASWTGLLNTGAQAFGTFFVFLLIALFSRITRGGRRPFTPRGRGIAEIILIGVLPVTHLLGSIVGLTVLGTLGVLQRPRNFALVLFSATVFGSWAIFSTIGFFDSRFLTFITEIFRLDLGTQASLLDDKGSDSRQAVAIVRILFSGLILVSAIAGGLLSWKLTGWTAKDRFALAVLVGMGLAAIIVGGGYGMELYQRFYFFMLPSLCYFAVKLLIFRYTRLVFPMILLISLPLTVISQYGSQAMDYLSPSFLTGAYFFHDKTSDGVVTGVTPIGRLRNHEKYIKISFTQLEHQLQRTARQDYLNVISPDYVVITDYARSRYAFFNNDEHIIDDIERELNKPGPYTLVYNNQEVKIFRKKFSR